MFYSLMYLYTVSLFSLLVIRKHIFMCLLSLEFVVVSLLLIMLNYLLFFNMGFYMILVMMVFFVCEGVLGLSILVSMIRCYGNDFLNSMILW